MTKKVFTSYAPFVLESGKQLPGIELVYHTYGQLNSDKSNVIWLCHALTANSDAADWWHELVGNGKLFDTEKYFIVCANIIGSCYGSSGPLTINSVAGMPYYSTFPEVTIRDMVKAHILLREYLNIQKIYIAAGSSMGGYQAMEWALMEVNTIENLVLLATGEKESAWGIAIHTAQRLAIEADSTWKEDSIVAGKNGLKAARAIGMLTYRNYETFVNEQDDTDTTKLDNFKASTYINYQGDKLVKRFNAQSYWLLSKAMDSHNVGRGRTEKCLSKILSKTLVVGISSDILCPVAEQKLLAQHIPNAKLVIIDSKYGHDGFLIEGEKISKEVRIFLGN